MTYGSQKDGGAVFHLTPAEHELFKKYKPIVKKSAFSGGDVRIMLKMTLKRSRRFTLIDCQSNKPVKKGLTADSSELVHRKVEIGSLFVEELKVGQCTCLED